MRPKIPHCLFIREGVSPGEHIPPAQYLPLHPKSRRQCLFLINFCAIASAQGFVGPFYYKAFLFCALQLGHILQDLRHPFFALAYDSSTARSVVIAVAFLSLCHSRQATLPGAVPCTPLPGYSMFPRFLARSLSDPGAASPKRYCRGRYSLVRRFLAFYTIRDVNFG